MRHLYKMMLGLALGAMSINVLGADIAVVKSDNAIFTTPNLKTKNLLKGEQIDIILDQYSKQDLVVEIGKDGNYGYIDKRHIYLQEANTDVLVEGANLRSEPDPTAEVIAQIGQDAVVSVKYKYVEWYAVELEDGQAGFVYKSQIEDEKLDLLKEKDKEELDKLLGKAQPIEVINWSEASKVLPRGGVAVIEDVYTGKRFSIKRTFGTNHADIETLTAADTTIMKEIWGGFNWERRPVIVHIDGRRLAASLAGMPHAGKDSAPNLAYTYGLSGGYGYGQNLDAVKGNNMNGVSDLHFLGSRKHKDGLISATTDPLHQAAIKIAASF